AFIKWCEQEFAQTPYDVMFAGTSYCFDLSVFEMLFPLSQGKRIRMLESGVSIPDYIDSEENIFINTVPSVVRSLMDQQISWDNVVALNMAGEPVPKIFKDQLDFERMEVRNLYGPSEDTTYSTMYRFLNDELNYIPIGVPVGNTHLYILDDDLNILPIGVEGEICLSGQSIAKGYLNKQDLTDESFVENPFVDDQRMYRTGDIGKWTEEGLVAFTGRKDDQVKVRGFRIELGEIQYQLDCIDEIEQAIVIVKEVNGEKSITAYYTPRDIVSVDSLKETLEEHLPVYMVPAYFMEMETIPMNSNGKVEKKQLPEPESGQIREVIEPKTETQQRLLKLWEQSLNTTGFGIESNFFELGGHSLKATKLRGLILSEFQKEITLNELFEQPEIAPMAELIDSKPIYIEKKIERVAIESDSLIPLSYAQERLWVLTKFENASKAYHMPAAFKVVGNLNSETLESFYRP
ncbi:MAG: AMP-binding protein, partial [Crocinitomicaceae bacterium]|nr:AMP-binding protein [Crocinitomicaceae bacterium]